MWIAKDIQSLTNQEINLWSSIAKDLPLAQNLSWARAIAALGGKTFLVFSPDEGVGGMVFSTSTDGAQGKYDCVNGPYLHWDNVQSAPRQLATFIMATAKLSDGFKSLSIKPRWQLGDMERRTSYLPVEVFDRSTTSTLVVPLSPSPEIQFAALAPRMRRTLSICKKEKIQTSWSPFNSDLADQFVVGMSNFGQKKHFTVPGVRVATERKV